MAKSNLELGFQINLKRERKLKKRVKEIASLIKLNKSLNSNQDPVAKYNKVKHRLETVQKKETTQSILENNPKAFLKKLPSLPSVPVSKNNNSNTLRMSPYIINILKDEYQGLQHERDILKRRRIIMDEKMSKLKPNREPVVVKETKSVKA